MEIAENGISGGWPYLPHRTSDSFGRSRGRTGRHGAFDCWQRTYPRNRTSKQSKLSGGFVAHESTGICHTPTVFRCGELLFIATVHPRWLALLYCVLLLLLLLLFLLFLS